MESLSKKSIGQKDIVLLPYPFSDLEGTKVRPAIIVSNNTLNEKSDDCIMIPLTSVIKNEPYSLIIEQSDLQNGTLVKTSRAKADKIFTVEKRLIILKIGTLKNETFDKIKKEILKVF